MRIHLTRIAAARGPATLMVAVTVTMCLPAGAATLHVGGGGAYVSIGAALTVAADGDTILVAPGTYSGPENTGLDFGGRNIVLRSGAGPDATTIDCGDSARALKFHSRERESAEVDGFTITNGFAEYGGGIYCIYACPTIRNCRFTDCAATEAGGAVRYSTTAPGALINCDLSGNSAKRGGAVSMHDTDVQTVSCSFSGNSASEGGAIHIAYSGAHSATDCLFDRNDASTGGAIYSIETALLKLETCGFTMNTSSGLGGAIRSEETDTLRVKGCTFSSNASDDSGGAIRAWGGLTSLESCRFEGNSAFRNGGGFVAQTADVEIRACEFVRNSAGRDGGGVYLDLVGSLAISGCLFEENDAKYVAALRTKMRHTSDWGEVDHCTFHANTASSDFGACHSNGDKYWACVFSNNRSPNVTALYAIRTEILNCSFVFNEATDGSGSVIKGIHDWKKSWIVRSVVAFSIDCKALNEFNSDWQVEHCCFYENDMGTGGNYSSDIEVDPLFCDVYDGDVTLCANSPCRLGGNTWGVHVGALDPGCGDCNSPVTPMSWGAIKALYR